MLAEREDARFVPPPVPEMHECLDDLEKYLHDSTVELPILIQRGILESCGSPVEAGARMAGVKKAAYPSV